MKDGLTESVARLYRAGSEHSQQTKKLRQAVDNLLRWMLDNLSHDFVLPLNCKLYPSGEFTYTVCDKSSVRENFTLAWGKKHSVYDLHLFSALIADGFIDKLSEFLEKEHSSFSETTIKLEGFRK